MTLIEARTEVLEQAEQVAKEKDIPVISEAVFWGKDDPRWDTATTLGFKRQMGRRGGHHIELDKDAYIIVFTGRRGGGKNESMTYWAMRAHYMYGLRLISNYPFEYILHRFDGTNEHVKAEPLDLYRLICFDSDYENCLILLDEAPDIIGHMASQTWKNRLLNIWIRQLRKHRNSLFAAAQEFRILDNNFRWQTDVIVQCQDASRRFPNSPIRRGEIILQEIRDNSGMWTGKTWEDRQRHNIAYHVDEPLGVKKKLVASFLWGDATHKPVYDSYEIQDVFDSLKRVDMKLDSYNVGPGHQDNEAIASVVERVINTVAEIKDEREDRPEMLQRDFWEKVGASDKEKGVVSRFLNKGGSSTRKSGNNLFYNFINFNPDKFLQAMEARR